MVIGRAQASLLGLSSCILLAAFSRDASAQGWEPQPAVPDAPAASQLDREAAPAPTGPQTLFVELLRGEVAYATPPIRGGPTRSAPASECALGWTSRASTSA